MSTSLQLKAYSLIKAVLYIVILLNFFSSILYKMKKLCWLIKVIALIFTHFDYIYIITKKKNSCYYFDKLIYKKL